MLEVLNVLSRSPKPLQYDVIFLFNGGEESLLPVNFMIINLLIFAGWFLRQAMALSHNIHWPRTLELWLTWMQPALEDAKYFFK